MTRRDCFKRSHLQAALAFACLLVTPAPNTLHSEETTSSASSKAIPPRDLADEIDRQIAEKWQAVGIQPSDPVDDAQFLRRVYLDVNGVIPSASRVRSFLDDRCFNRREQIVDELLDSPRYVRHFVNVWHSLLLPESDTDSQAQYVASEFDAWLRKKLAGNTPYDEMVREILTVRLPGNGANGVYAYYSSQREPRPTAFYAVKESKPENLASAAARAFLGVRVDCAQCHDHPFADWTQDEFWAYTAFFSDVRSERSSVSVSISRFLAKLTSAAEKSSPLQISIPDTERTVAARFLDGGEPDIDAASAPRQALADWLLSDDNSFFSRAAVNRLWAIFFGRGLVDPVDNMELKNPASHPELLDTLAREFQRSGYNTKYLIRAITTSKTYQLSSLGADSEEQPELFARMQPKVMSAEQLYHSLVEAVGRTKEDPSSDNFFLGQSGSKREITQLFRLEGEQTSRETSMLQALALMNGHITSEATSRERSSVLLAVAELPGIEPHEQLESLFLATLTREPTDKEIERLTNYMNSKPKRQKEALGDILWVLLNSSEFQVIP